MRCIGRTTGGALLASAALMAGAPAGAGASAPASAFYHGTVVSGANPTTAPANTLLRAGSLRVAARAIGAASGEPTIGVDRRGAVYFPADNFDSADGALAHTTLLRSTDQGASWQDVSPRIAGQPTHQKSLDTYLFVDKHYGRIFHMDLLGGATQLSMSDDQGATWTESVASAAGFNDHETLTTGVVPKLSGLTTSDPAFPKVVYYCANTVAAVTCSRSLDGGRTFAQVNSPFPDHVADNLPLSTLCSSLTGH